MINMKLFIKNMVCHRCIMVVRQELENLGYTVLHLTLGEAEIDRNISNEEKSIIHNRLIKMGFELFDDKKSRWITQIKSLIIDLVQNKNSELTSNLSDYLSRHIHQDYNYLSKLFSEVEGTTIEKYFIAQKIEKVKELLVYDEMSLSEISYQLNYSSVAHLSNQFKKVTGLTPSHFKNIKAIKRKPLDKV